MAGYTRRAFNGAAAATTLSASITDVATSMTIASYTNWPYGSNPFYIVVDPGTAAEEKILVTRTGSSDTTLNVVSGGRGADDTSAQAHDSGASLFPVFTATDANEANVVASTQTTKGDLLLHTGSAHARLGVGTDGQALVADSAEASGVKWAGVGDVTLSGTETLTNKTISLGSNTVSGTLAQFNTAVSDADLVSLAGAETLTNKTIDLTDNTVSGTLAEFNAAVSDADLVSLAGAETLTNKTVALGSNTVSGTLAEFNTAVTDADLVSLAGTETLSNKTLSSPTVTDLVTVEGASNPQVIIKSNDSSDPYLYFGDQVDNVRVGIGLDVSENRLHFRGYDNSTRMVIDSSGNVGINNLTPSYRLDVNGKAHLTDDLEIDNTIPTVILRDTNGTLGSNVGGYILYQDSASATQGLVGFAGDDKLYVRNYDGPVYLRTELNDSIFFQPNLTLTAVVGTYGLRMYQDGSVTVPSISFTSDTNTGIYRFGADSLGITSGGVNAILTSSAGTISTALASTATTSGYQYVLRDNTFGFLYRYTSKGALKENITDLGDTGAIIDALRPVSFTAKFVPQFEGHEDTPEAQAFREADTQIGFIAEEVAQVDPRLAQWEAEGDELVPAGWRWEHMVSVLVKEVQSLRARVEALEAQQMT